MTTRPNVLRLLAYSVLGTLPLGALGVGIIAIAPNSENQNGFMPEFTPAESVGLVMLLAAVAWLFLGGVAVVVGLAVRKLSHRRLGRPELIAVGLLAILLVGWFGAMQFAARDVGSDYDGPAPVPVVTTE